MWNVTKQIVFFKKHIFIQFLSMWIYVLTWSTYHFTNPVRLKLSSPYFHPQTCFVSYVICSVPCHSRRNIPPFYHSLLCGDQTCDLPITSLVLYHGATYHTNTWEKTQHTKIPNYRLASLPPHRKKPFPHQWRDCRSSMNLHLWRRKINQP